MAKIKRMPWATELSNGREVWVRADDLEHPAAHGVIVRQSSKYDWFVVRLDDGTEIECGSTALNIETEI